MDYKALHFKINNTDEAGLLASLLQVFDFEGFEEKDGELIGYIRADKLPHPVELQKAAQGFIFNMEDIPDQNWNALWESNFEPVLVEDFCGIRADFHAPFKKVKYEIVINPRMSFGTGHHATTQMMIRLMEDIDFKEKKVLDFGTGTGILSILSRKMGAGRVVAIDNDSNAVENASENIKENVEGDLDLYCRDIPVVEGEKFDVILANINRNIILNSAESLISSLAPKGLLLLSGFLQKDKPVILETFLCRGFLPDKELNDGDWVAARLKSI